MGEGVELPSGLIAMWSGAVADVPMGWFICDGTNGTPDLEDRFVIHADADSGGTNDVGDTGGADEVTLTLTELPAHTHEVETRGAGLGAGTYPYGPASTVAGTDATSSDGVETVGSGSAFSIKPKFYALAYIMKS